MKTITALISVIILVAGCATNQPKPMERPAFLMSEYTNLATEGTGIVEGQAFLKTRGGDVKTAAGNFVRLNPVTSYSIFWYENNYVKGLPLKPIDPRLDSYLIKKLADGSGRFKFINVPPGEYYLGAMVTWDAATGYRGALQQQGGYVAKRITVRNNETTEAIVTY